MKTCVCVFAYVFVTETVQMCTLVGGGEKSHLLAFMEGKVCVWPLINDSASCPSWPGPTRLHCSSAPSIHLLVSLHRPPATPEILTHTYTHTPHYLLSLINSSGATGKWWGCLDTGCLWFPRVGVAGWLSGSCWRVGVCVCVWLCGIMRKEYRAPVEVQGREKG